MKKLICFLMALTMVLSVSPVFAADNVFTYYTDDGLCAVVDVAAKTLTVSGNGPMADYTADSRPAWYEKKALYTKVIIENGVTSVGDYAFADNLALVSASVPDSVTSVGDYAFHHCIKLTEMHLPDSVTEIGIYALADCLALKTVTLPPVLKEIPRALFRCSYYIESVEMPTSCASIGGQAFMSCSYLDSVTLPEDLKYIGDFAFNACNALASIQIPSGTEYIGNFAFYQLSKLEEIKIPKSVTFIGEDAFCNTPWYNALSDGFHLVNGIVITYKGTPSGKTLYLPHGAHTIAPGVCGKANYVTEVVLPASVKVICEKAFYNLTSLYSITIPEGVTEIGSYALGYYASSSGAPSAMYPYTISSVTGGAAYDYAVENKFDFVCLHKDGSFVNYPDCTVGGVAQSACIYCGEILGDVTVEAGEHLFGEAVTSEATCTQDGTTSATCTLCGFEDVTVIQKATGHTADGDGIKIKDATCSEAGLIYKTCAVCGESFDCIEIQKTAHTAADTQVVVKEPTCTQAGEYAVLCRDCGFVLESGELAATGHSISAGYKALSQSDYNNGTKGLCIRDCTVCGIVMEYEYYIKGDINEDGRINARDTMMLKRSMTQLVSAKVRFLGDMNGDGRINARDTMMLKTIVSNKT